MKSTKAVIDELNYLLADELTAISQYMVHSEMCANWGYAKMHEIVEKRAIDEMKHAEKLIGRILFLEGKPMVSKLNQMKIGAVVKEQLEFDRDAESVAIGSYNKAIKLMADAGDNGSKILLEEILKDEETHIDKIEEQLDQIGQMGIENFLLGQK